MTKTLTCQIGKFVFALDGSLSLSLMKRIRDDVMGQFLAPAPGSKRLKTVDDAYSFVKNDLEINVPFSLVLS